MNAWRELTVLRTLGRVFERRAETDSLSAALGRRALRLLGLIDRRRQRNVAPADADFGPDTDIQVFFMDTEPTASGDAARMKNGS